MAIQDNDSKPSQAAPAAPSPAVARTGLEPPPRPSATTVSGQPSASGSGVHDLPALLRRSPIGFSGYGEAVKKLSNTIREIFKADTNGETDFKVLVLDKEQRSTALSAVVIAMGVTRGTQSFVAAHTLVVEGSASRLPKIQFNAGNQPIELTATASDTYNNAMWEKVKQLVGESGYPANSTIGDAYCTVIPSEMDLADVDRVRRIVFYAVQAVYSRLEQLTNTPLPAFSVGKFTRNDRVTVKVDFTTQGLESTTGLPIRSDVSVVLNASNVQNNQDFIPTAGKDFSRVDGYIDLVFKTPMAPQMMMQQMPGYPQQAMYHYYPRFVMTNVAPLLEGVNLELLLLALSSATNLSQSDNYAWGGVFRQRYGAEKNLRDIGAIGLEIPALVGSTDGTGRMIDTQASTWDNQALLRLLSSVVHPRLTYSFDIDEGGSLCFIQMIFAAAAGGDAAANQMLIDAANRLTDGHFNEFFPGGACVADDNNRIHLGYYIDAKGKKCDIRDVDYLAVLNMVRNDNKVAVQWANTFDRKEIPLDIRMDERERMLNTLIGGMQMRITGYGRRITFNPNYLAAIAQGCYKAGLIIQPGDRSYFFNDQVIRGDAGIDQWVFGGAMAQPLFTQSNQYVGGRQIQSVASRFGR